MTAPPAASLAEFETRLEQLRGDARIPGISVVIARGQQVVWARGFGLANIEFNQLALPSTSFHLASLTKPFAAAVIMQLVEEGKVNLDDPVSQYGIQLPSSGIVRVRHLLTHTSEGAPGSVFRYNGDRFGLLDGVIQRATGRTFAQELQTRILGPLSLPNTAPNNRSAADFATSGKDRTSFEANLATGYTSSGSSVTPTAYPVYFGTAAGLIASGLDMAAFSMAMDRDMFVSAATKAQMFAPALSTDGTPLKYGLGWFVTTDRGVKVLWHYGLWVANSSLIIKVPERGLTYVVLANTSGLSESIDIIGNLRNSPWAREFLDAIVHGAVAVP
ncbi:MAG TPA: serine hydrolase domain-containing protein [Gemmatimonadaceae bacterium]|nr:serine hydrolase domain-containing protein [Gemmatimonadaceae bacterium]